MSRISLGTAARIALVAPAVIVANPAQAGMGDLLVAPTRVVLNGSRGTEVILNNIGDGVATYRISAELRRMTPDGKLVDVELPNDKEKAAQGMVLYAPRKVTLPPNQPQAIRLSARAPEGLPDGEYRVHMLFRAIPAPQPAAAPLKKAEGVSFQLRPIYGVTIPVIVRLGNLEAKAALSNVHKVSEDGKPAIAVDISRTGSRSTFGEVRVLKAGVEKPIAMVSGVAVYTEIGQRTLKLPVDPTLTAYATGQVTVQYVEPTDTGPVTLAETSAVLN
ncbi:molecular chaperone [Sphingomonas sp. NSE70-1]|uniref:Molecular chaperone n=1 Tax=Sphingomonas caseinilyticus TaxID=2908205 RepID=A0ABT0RVA0_9SPHN|nr:molecular chaperone [Sphingomonas caseinilyticus]MCL6698819.1 molecular chaperone [Sphingomonas caseinilyticus]